jgi:hypothetical protein
MGTTIARSKISGLWEKRLRRLRKPPKGGVSVSHGRLGPGGGSCSGSWVAQFNENHYFVVYENDSTALGCSLCIGLSSSERDGA